MDLIPPPRSHDTLRSALDGDFDHVMESTGGVGTARDGCDPLPVGRPGDSAVKKVAETVWPALTGGNLSLFRAVRISNYQYASSRPECAAHKSNLLAVRRKTDGTAYIIDHSSRTAAEDRHPVQFAVLNAHAPVCVIKKIAVG